LKGKAMIEQKPVCGIGAKLPQGTVVSINRDTVTIEKKDGSEGTLTFAQVENLFFKKE
tara:strand:- start:591 stop:764 length:174 start_codon:yes stop_codon:yes gene_type:complete